MNEDIEQKAAQLANILKYELINCVISDDSEADQDTTLEYENCLTSVVAKNYQYPELEDILAIIIGDSSQEMNVRYAAFYALHIFCRRNRRYEHLASLLEKWNSSFSGYASFKHLTITAKMFTGQGMDVLDSAEQYYKKFPAHLGMSQCLAEVIVKAYEDAKSDDERASLLQKWMPKADREIDRVLRLQPYNATFCCTRGRIYKAQKKFDLAKEAIEKAIAYEKPDRGDYYSKTEIFHYHLMLTLFEEYEYKTKISFSNLSEENKEISKELKASLGKNIEYMALFTAVVSFVIGALNITKQMVFIDIFCLIIALMGSVVCVFSTIGIILNGWRKLESYMVFLVGIVLIAFSLIVKYDIISIFGA